jgi:hypothetical protein
MAVVYVDAVTDSVNSLNVSWSIPSDEIEQDVVYNYSLVYQGISPCALEPVVVALNQSGPNWVLMQNLLRGNVYSVKIIIASVASVCVSSASQLVSAQTPAALPESAFANFSVASGSTDITVTWTPPLCTQQHGDILWYEVIYQRVANQARADPSIPGSIVHVNVTDTSVSPLKVVLSSLQPSIQFSIQMRASNAAGATNFTDPVVLATLSAGS